MTVETTQARPLLRILGLGFGLAIAFGGTVGVGILRLPGTVALALGDSRLVTVFWILGGVYSLFGAFAIAELAAMFPEAGGFRVFARRAFGDGAGFVVGWTDWLCSTASLAYASITAASFLGALWPAATTHPQVVALAVLAVFTGLHWIGLRIGRSLAGFISVAVGVMLLVLVVGCFLRAPVAESTARPVATAAASAPALSLAMFAAVVTALRSVLVTFDGWYAPMYFAEESTEPTRVLPRAIIGGTLLVAVFYVVINLALLRVLPLPVLAASELPAADAARVVLPRGGAELVTVIALLTVLCLMNAYLLATPRILFAIGRDGFFSRKAAIVSAGGTPRVALGVTSAVVALLIVSGTFEQCVALAAVLFLICYVSTYAAMFTLRRRAPDAPRPYRALGYPLSTAIVLAGSVLILLGAVVEDPRSGIVSAIAMAACGPVYLWVARRRRESRVPEATLEKHRTIRKIVE
jgi:basic amino acid/polyamine antiporter, APA family